MQDMYKERLGNIMPWEQLELGLSVIALFEDIGFTAPFEPLQEIMEVGTSFIDSDQLVSRVQTCLSDSLDDLLKAFGVEVREQTPIALKQSIALTLAQLPQYYLPSEILGMIEASTDHEETFAELVRLTQGVLVEEVLDYLFSVNDQLIPKIAAEMRNREQLIQAEERINTEPAVDRLRIININRLLKDPRASDHLTIVRELLEAGAAVGADYEALTNQYVMELSIKPADHMTYELLGLALFSNLPPDQWLERTNKAAGEFTDRLSDHRKIEAVLDGYKVFFEM